MICFGKGFWENLVYSAKELTSFHIHFSKFCIISVINREKSLVIVIFLHIKYGLNLFLLNRTGWSNHFEIFFWEIVVK